MNDRAKFPSLELYPLHDKDGFLEFAFGMWINTWDLVGKPTAGEVALTLIDQGWPVGRVGQVLETLRRRRYLAIAAPAP